MRFEQCQRCGGRFLTAEYWTAWKCGACGAFLIRILAVLALMLLPSLAGAQTFRVTFGASLAADAADLATTAQALRSGFHEANPMLRPAVVPLKVAMASSFAVGLWKLHRKHPKMATALLMGNAAVKGWAAWHNARVLTELRR